MDSPLVVTEFDMKIKPAMKLKILKKEKKSGI